MEQPLLEFDRVTKRFGGTLAVDDVSLSVGAGEILALLTRPADLGALADPQRWSACLGGLKRDPATPVLGATPVTVNGRSAVLVVLPTGESGQVDSVTAVVLNAGCGAADTRPLAEKTLHRP